MLRTVSVGALLAAGALVVPNLAFAQPTQACDSNNSTATTTDDCPQGERGPTNVEELVVVGSHLRRDNFNTPSPIEVINREERLLAGTASITETLQSNAVTAGGAQINNAFGGFVTQGGPGANTLGLRGLGATRTLILLNGRRVAPAGTRGGVGAADLNVLPDAIVDRIEILKDGASSIYGSDAVAGVVNIITRQNINGITMEGSVEIPEHGGGNQYRVSVVGGYTNDRLSIAGSAEILRAHQSDSGRPQLDPLPARRLPQFRQRSERQRRLHRSADRPAEVLSDHAERRQRRHHQHDRHQHPLRDRRSGN